MKKLGLLRLPILVSPLLFLWGCESYEPLEHPTSDSPVGRGILSGEKGYFEIDLD